MPNPPTPEQIKAARQSANLSQLELAAHLIDATPEQLELIRDWYNALRSVRYWESGTHTPDRDNTKRLRRTLNLPA